MPVSSACLARAARAPEQFRHLQTVGEPCLLVREPRLVHSTSFPDSYPSSYAWDMRAENLRRLAGGQVEESIAPSANSGGVSLSFESVMYTPFLKNGPWIGPEHAFRVSARRGW